MLMLLLLLSVLLLDLLWVWLYGVGRGSDTRHWISTRLWLLVVGRVLWVLERLALPNAAVYHTGEMHCHGEREIRVTGHNSGCVTVEE